MMVRVVVCDGVVCRCVMVEVVVCDGEVVVCDGEGL